MSSLDSTKPFIPVNIAVLTVSDTRTSENDTSGDALVQRIEAAGHVVAARSIVRDDVQQLAAMFRTWIDDPLIDVIISTGAVKDGWDDILVWQLDSRHRPCNLVELMPRLREK